MPCVPVKSIESFVTSVLYTLKWFYLSVDSHMNFQTVRSQKCLAAVWLGTFESKFTCNKTL